MEEIQEEIMDAVRINGEISINELHRQIGGNRNTITRTYNKMIQMGDLTIRKSGNKKILSLKNTDFEQYFKNFNAHIKFDIDIAFREILALRKFTPICKITEHTKNTLQYWTNPKARPHINAIADRINRMFARSASLTYAETMNLIPKKYSKKIQQHNKLCLDVVRKIMDKLLKENKESEIPLRSMISWGVYGYKMLSQIEELSKSKKKSFHSSI